MLCVLQRAVWIGFAASALSMILQRVSFGDEAGIAELADQIVSDLGEWEAEAGGDPATECACLNASDLLVGLLVDSRRLDLAEQVAGTLGRDAEYWNAAHPILLSEKRFDEAAALGENIVRNNPRMRSFLIADTFSAIATASNVEDGLAYLDGLTDIDNINTRSALSAAFIRVARYYNQRGDVSASEKMLSQIESIQEREIANAVLAARQQSFNETAIRPLFLRIVEGRTTTPKTRRARQPWFVSRVQAYGTAVDNGTANLTRYRQQIAGSQPVHTLTQPDRAIGMGLDLIITCSLSANGTKEIATGSDTGIVNGEQESPPIENAEEPKLLAAEETAEQLSRQFVEVGGASGSGLTRSWIAYALSRSGRWTTQDVKAAWNSRHKFDSAEWIMGFAAGFDQAGRGETVQRLVDVTKTTNARCYLRMGQLISRVSAETDRNSIPRHAMK